MKRLVMAVAAIGLAMVAIWLPFRPVRLDSAVWKANADIKSSHSARSRMQRDVIARLTVFRPTRDAVQTMLGNPDETFKAGDHQEGNEFFQKATDYYWLSNPMGGSKTRADNCEILVIEYDAQGRVWRAYRDVYTT